MFQVVQADAEEHGGPVAAHGMLDICAQGRLERRCTGKARDVVQSREAVQAGIVQGGRGDAGKRFYEGFQY